VSRRLWFKAGAPNGERNLQNYNPMIRAEEQIKARGIKTAVAGFQGLPKGVKLPVLAAEDAPAAKPKKSAPAAEAAAAPAE
jgi:hypothetical protein